MSKHSIAALIVEGNGIKAKLSGFGSLYEFYHCIVDFAPTVAFELRDYPACAPPKTLYLPGWVRDDKFHRGDDLLDFIFENSIFE